MDFWRFLAVYGVFEAAQTAVLVVAVYITARVVFLKIKKQKRKPLGEEIARALLAGYITALAVIVWDPAGVITTLISGVNYVFGRYTNNMAVWRVFFGDMRGMKSAVFELLANVALFVPLGVLLPLVWNKLKLWQVDLICLGVTGVVELVQPLFGRTGDLDDIITNFLGGVIGCLISKTALKIINSRKKRSNCLTTKE